LNKNILTIGYIYAPQVWRLRLGAGIRIEEMDGLIVGFIKGWWRQ